MKKALSALALTLAALPTLALAQTPTTAPLNTGGLIAIINLGSDLINRLIPFIIALTVLIFLFGVFKFVFSGGDGDARKEAQGYMIWGIIALFVMVSVWGLVNILVRSFNLENSAPKPPAFITTPPEQRLQFN